MYACASGAAYVKKCRDRAPFLCTNKSCMDFPAQLPKVTVAIWLLHSNRPLWGRSGGLHQAAAQKCLCTRVIFEPAAQLISPRAPSPCTDAIAVYTIAACVITGVICIRYLCTPPPCTPSPCTSSPHALSPASFAYVICVRHHRYAHVRHRRVCNHRLYLHQHPRTPSPRTQASSSLHQRPCIRRYRVRKHCLSLHQRLHTTSPRMSKHRLSIHQRPRASSPHTE